MNVRKRLRHDIELFDDVQEKWVAFRNSECAVRSISARAFRDAEAQRQLLIKSCAVKLNNERIMQLKKVQSECDSCLQ